MAKRDGDRVWNQLQPWNASRLEFIPTENAATGELNYVPYYSVTRPNENPLSSSSTNVPPYRVPTSGLCLVNYHSPPATSTSTDFSSNWLQHGPSFNQHTMHSEEFGFTGPTNSGRGSFKRKWSPMPMVYDGRNTARCFNGESSYSHLLQKPISDSQHPPWDNMVANSQGIELSRQGFQRNVRFRHSNSLPLDAGSSRSHFSTNFPSRLNLMEDLPGPSTRRQQNHSLASVASHDYGAFKYEMNQSFPGSSRSNFLHVGNRLHNSVHSRYLCSPLAVHDSAQVMGESSGNHNQRAPHSWRSMSGPYIPSEDATASSHENHQLVRKDLCRHSMSFSTSGGQHGSGRSGRIRDSYGRFHSLPVMANTHGRWMPQGFEATDRRILYDSSIALDQHQDMRLDIDSMSYEELLALGERIGNVNTGLPDDKISMCLTRTIYHCSLLQVQDAPDAGSCAICLENYKVGEELGNLRCGHGYHFCCIKPWLEIKNSCPICKASALER